MEPVNTDNSKTSLKRKISRAVFEIKPVGGCDDDGDDDDNNKGDDEYAENEEDIDDEDHDDDGEGNV